MQIAQKILSQIFEVSILLHQLNRQQISSSGDLNGYDLTKVKSASIHLILIR